MSENLTPKETKVTGKAKKRPAPLSIRFSEAEKQLLLDEACGFPLSTYVRGKALNFDLPSPMRRKGIPVQDRKALAQAIALLAESRISNSLGTLAIMAKMGTLPMTLDTLDEIEAALKDIQHLKFLIYVALGYNMSETL